MQVLVLDGGDRSPYLAQLVARLASMGVAMHYAADARVKDFPALEAAGVRCVHLPIRHKLDFFARHRLRALLRERRVDVLHTVTGRDAYQGVRARGRLPVRVLARRGAYPKISRFDPADLFVYGRRGADLFVAVSRDLERHMVARGIAPERVRTIYTGIWSEALAREPRDLRREFGVGGGVPLVGFVGNLRRVKGADLLFAAMAGVDAHLFVAGRDEKGDAPRLARRFGIERKATFAGYQPDFARHLPSLDCVVVPSRIDALPRTAIEATVLGVPVVGFRSGGIPEILDGARCGWLVEPGDVQGLAAAIREALSDAEARRTRVEAALARNRDLFSVERCAAEHLATYERLAGAGRGAP